jgi:hypothetical protein
VGKQTEEELKERIFKAYTEFYENPSSDRRDTYTGQLCNFLLSLCVDYLFKHKIEGDAEFPVKEGNIMGAEICDVAKRLVENAEKKEFNDKNALFYYVKKALYNARAEYYGENERELMEMEISKYKNKKRKEIKYFINMREGDLGRKLTHEERKNFLQNFLGIQDDKACEYITLAEKKYVESLEANYDNEKMDILNSEKVKEFFKPDVSYNPKDIFFPPMPTSKKMSIICDIIKSVLEKETQKRTRPVYKALLTALFIAEAKEVIDYKELLPVLDEEVIEDYRKSGVIPNQYDIYLKYHPNDKISSAQVSSSQMLNRILTELSAVIKEKYPELIPKSTKF